MGSTAAFVSGCRAAVCTVFSSASAEVCTTASGVPACGVRPANDQFKNTAPPNARVSAANVAYRLVALPSISLALPMIAFCLR